MKPTPHFLRKDFREYFLKYDLKANTTTKLEVKGWDGDLVLHGIDIWRFKDNPSKVHLFAVNHGRKGESITVFSHKLGSNTLEFVKDISNPLLKTPNAVTPSGPLVSGDFQYANGVLLTEDGKTLLVNDLYEGTTIIYDVDPVTKDLILERKVVRRKAYQFEVLETFHSLTKFFTQRLGGTPDNLAEIPISGDIVVPVFPNLESLFKRGFGPGGLDYGTLCESAVVRLDKAKGYAPELLFWDDGSQLSVLTGAAVDPYHKKLIAGGMFSKGFIVCNISNDSTGVHFD
ncbi:hypothetical protein LTS17_003464 [Exophiala oligosperma]